MILYLSLLLILALSEPIYGERTYYIVPSNNISCPASFACYTLSDVIENTTLAERVFQSNSKLVFISGDHVLDNISPGLFFLVRDKENITLEGTGELVHGSYGTLESSVRIICNQSFGLAFANITGFSLKRLTFIGCGANLTKNLISLAFEEQTHSAHSTTTAQKVALLLVNIQDCRMDVISIQDGLGYGLLAVNILGDSLITNSAFIGNNMYTTVNEFCQYPPEQQEDIIKCNGGNALFYFEDLLECPSQKDIYKLNISNCIFALGSSPYGGQLPKDIVNGGTGIGVMLTQSSYGVNVFLDRLTCYGNGALVGANIYLTVHEPVDNSTINVLETEISRGNNVLLRTTNQLGLSDGFSAGLQFEYGVFLPFPVCRSGRKYQRDVLLVSGCTFSNNSAFSGAAIYMYITLYRNYLDATGMRNYVARFRIRDSNFTNNQGVAGVGVSVQQLSTISVTTKVQTIIENVLFYKNGFILPLTNISKSANQYEFSVLKAVGTENVIMKDCQFTESDASAISLFESNLIVAGNNLFEGNIGTAGGAMSIINSFLYIAPNTRIRFVNNTAVTRGGAIKVVANSDVTTALLCFFQVEDPSYQDDPNITLFFRDNYAGEAGSVLYGGSIDECIVGSDSVYFGETSTYVFNQITDIGFHKNDTSMIASDPTDVCACKNGIPDCDNTIVNFNLYPGEIFHVPVVALGQRYGNVPALVYANYFMPSNLSLDESQQFQEVDKVCTNLTFTAKSNSDYVAPTIQLHTESPLPGSVFVIAINILRCPLGFVLSNGVCTCDPVSHISDYNVTCDLQRQTIRRASGGWINASFTQQGEYSGLIIHNKCPYDYCLPTTTDVNLSYPDSQCAYNRTGILCGSCKQGYSLTLGNSQCRKCSNATIALVLAYALAGLTLVTLLFALNLTISVGTLGGIIIYTNIIFINLATFFPEGSTNIIVVFIAWLNLYPGTDYCFFDGMDSYSKTWLEFGFPFYIWFIIGVIVLVSRFSFTVARLTGPRVLPVLATLLLLSYTKLLQAVIFTLNVTTLLQPTGKLNAVWSSDGNVDYFRGKHIPLGIFAILILLLFHLPYTLLLVLAPLPKVQALTKYRLLAWINKLKPLLDAYYSPYKDRYRNWTGVLLLVRIVLALLVSLNFTNDPSVTVLIHTIMMFLLMAAAWLGGGVYKKWTHNVLECFFFVNIGVLSVTTLFNMSYGGRQEVAFFLSGSLALVVFIGILIYHIGTQLKQVKWIQKKVYKMQEKIMPPKKATRKDSVKNDEIANGQSVSPMVTYSSVQLREPLIDDDS